MRHAWSAPPHRAPASTHWFWQPFTHVLRLLEPPVLLVHFVFFARQLAAHVTPLPGAKQLANAVSYSASHSRALAETRQIFLSAVACLMHAPVLGLNAGTRVVVVVDDATVVVVLGRVGAVLVVVVVMGLGAVVVVVGRLGLVVVVVLGRLGLVVVVVVGRLGLVVVVVVELLGGSPSVVVVVLDSPRVVVVDVGRGRVVVVVVVVGRGRVVVVVRWGVVHATTHASYFARATSRHAWSRPTHWPPSAIHWF